MTHVISRNNENVIAEGCNLTHENIAFMVHEMVRAFNYVAYAHGYDKNMKAFLDLDTQEKVRIIEAVKREAETPTANNEDSHARWMKARLEDGWKWGEKLDRANKIHPNLKPYKDLPASEKLKDTLFKSIVGELKAYL